MANNQRATELMKALLDVALEEKANAIPQLKTNPAMKRWFALGYWCGVDAQGEALIRVMMKGDDNGSVQEKEDESSGDSRES